MPEGSSFIIQNESSLRCAYSVAFPQLKNAPAHRVSKSILSAAISVFTIASQSLHRVKCSEKQDVCLACLSSDLWEAE